MQITYVVLKLNIFVLLSKWTEVVGQFAYNDKVWNFQSINIQHSLHKGTLSTLLNIETFATESL